MNPKAISLSRVLLLFSLLATLGCGAQPHMTASDMAKESGTFHDSLLIDRSDSKSEGSDSGEIHTSLPSSMQAADVERRIIYTADFKLVVDDIEEFDREIKSRVKKFGGYFASGNLTGREDRQRRGTWRLRVPVEHFETIIAEIEELGYPEDSSRDSQDVTEEFVDLTARIESKRKLEERVLKLLERKEDKIQHVIEVERELARIRSEIERMEGRLRYLKDRISLTTITISAREEKDYTPPQAPVLGDRINTAWTISWENLQKSATNFLVWLVSAIPFLLVWLPVLIVLWLAYRIVRVRLGRRSQAQAS